MSSCRIYLSGAHSTGKTTILNDLKPHLKIHVQEEIARNVIRKLNWKRSDFLPDVYPENFLKLNEEILRQQIHIDECLSNDSKDFIADRCVDPLIYVQRYIGAGAKEKLLSIPGLHKWVERLKTALIFVVKPHKECIKDDNVRLPPKLDDLLEFHDAIIREYRALDIPIYDIQDLNRQARKTFILEKIQEKFPNVLI